MAELKIDDYEVLSCEPLHDLTNVIKNLIEELPHHVGECNKQEFLSFSETTIGNKNQIKGSDARLYAVKLAKFTLQKFEEGKLENKHSKTSKLSCRHCHYMLLILCHSFSETTSSSIQPMLLIWLTL